MTSRSSSLTCSETGAAGGEHTYVSLESDLQLTAIRTGHIVLQVRLRRIDLPEGGTREPR